MCVAALPKRKKIAEKGKTAMTQKSKTQTSCVVSIRGRVKEDRSGNVMVKAMSSRKRLSLIITYMAVAVSSVAVRGARLHVFANAAASPPARRVLSPRA